MLVVRRKKRGEGKTKNEPFEWPHILENTPQNVEQ